MSAQLELRYGVDPLADAIAWRRANPEAFAFIVELAREDTRRGIRPCMDAYGHILRRPHIAHRLGLTPRLGDPVLFNNNLTSSLARLLKREHGFDFALRDAKVDRWSAS